MVVSGGLIEIRTSAGLFTGAGNDAHRDCGPYADIGIRPACAPQSRARKELFQPLRAGIDATVSPITIVPLMSAFDGAAEA
jgi:hypothetical protein